MIRYRTFIALSGAVVLLAAAFTTGCEQKEKSEPPAGQKKATVTTAAVEKGSIRETVRAVGTLEAVETVEIRPEIDGIVEKIHFEEGARVSKDALLVTLQSDEIRRRVQRLKAQLEGALAEMDRARRFYERREELFERKVVSAETRDEALTQYRTAESRVDQLRAEILEAGEVLEKTRLTAPLAGFTGQLRVDAGDYVGVGDVLVPIFRIDPLSLEFAVPERFSGKVARGQPVRVSLPSLPGNALEGRVYYVGPKIRVETRDLPVKARVANPQGRLRPGAFASVELVVETRTEALLIPEEALVPTRKGYGVFVVEKETAHWRPVKIGLRRPGTVEIRRGLEAGETVVRAGHISLSDGAAVSTEASP